MNINNRKSIVKMVSSKKIFHKSSNNKKPVLMTDNFSYNRSNNNVKILRNTKLDNKRRLLIAESKGGPYHLVERTINGNNKTNRAYKVSEESIPQFVRASVNSISNRKNIKKCSSMKNSTKKTLLNNKNNKGQNNVSLQKPKKKVMVNKKKVTVNKKKVMVNKKKVTVTKKKTSVGKKKGKKGKK
jgi:hypothetical protein